MNACIVAAANIPADGREGGFCREWSVTEGPLYSCYHCIAVMPQMPSGSIEDGEDRIFNQSSIGVIGGKYLSYFYLRAGGRMRDVPKVG